MGENNLYEIDPYINADKITSECCVDILKGLGPGYLSCLVMLRKHRYEPRPQYQGQLQVPEAPLKSYGERSFGFSAPTEWNKLPIHVRSALTVASFKVKLKTHLYKICLK